MVEGVALNIDIMRFNHILRKDAHFFTYLILGVLTSNALKNSQVEDNKGFVIALIISVLYATSDEFYQLFIPGRSGQLKDIFIDSTGALIGITLYYKSKIFNLIKS